MIVFRIPEATALDPERISTNQNRVGHRICLIHHHPQRGDGESPSQYCHIVRRSCGNTCTARVVVWVRQILTRCCGGNNHSPPAISLELLHTYRPTAAIMASWLNDVRKLRGRLGKWRGFYVRVPQKLSPINIRINGNNQQCQRTHKAAIHFRINQYYLQLHNNRTTLLLTNLITT